MLERVEPVVRELVRSGRHHGDPAGALAACSTLAHTLKGGAGFLGFHCLAGVADAVEQFATGLGAAPGKVEPEDLLLLHETCLFFRQGLDHIRSTGTDEQLVLAADELIGRLLPTPAPAGVPGPDHESLEEFVSQVDELMQWVERELLLWDATSVDPGRLQELIAGLEELKGLFSDRGYTDLERICGAMANVLRRFYGGEVFQGEYPDKVFLGLVDVLYEGIDAIAAGGDGLVPKIEEHLEALRAIMRQPIGQLLVEAGLVDPQAVEEALRIQKQARAKKKTPKRLGDLLVAMGEVSSEEVDRAIRTGRACPVGQAPRPGPENADSPDRGATGEPPAAAARVTVDREQLRALLDHIALLEGHRAGMDGSLEQVVDRILRQAGDIARSMGG